MEDMPGYLFDIEDAKLLGVHPWEISQVPVHWRKKARVVDLAIRQARADLREKGRELI